MSASPFEESSRRYSSLASSLDDRKSMLSAVAATGSGAAITALNERIENASQALASLSESALQTSDTCDTQTSSDSKLLSAPSPHDVETAKNTAAAVRQQAMVGKATPSQFKMAQDAYNDAKSQRDSAYEEHESETQGHVFSPPDVETRVTAPHASRPADFGTLSPSGSGYPNLPGGGGDDFGGGGFSDDSPFGETHLSSDSGPSSPSPAMMQAQPQQPMGGQPGGMPMGGQPQMPQMAPMSPSAFKDTPKSKDLPKDNLPDYDLSDTAVGTSTSGDSGNASGTGSSVAGVTTRADVTGTPSGAVTAGGGVRGAGEAQGPMMRGGMGGMPMGAMGQGGNNSNSKERPEIFTEDKDLLGTETEDAAVKGGLIGRNTSSPG